MKKNLIKTLLLILLLLLAVVLGKIIGAASEGVRMLSWLGASARFGFAPITADLSVIKLTLGAQISVNVAQALLLLTAILLYLRIKIKE